MSDGWQIAEAIGTVIAAGAAVGGAIAAGLIAKRSLDVAAHVKGLEDERHAWFREQERRDRERREAERARERGLLRIRRMVMQHAERWAVQVVVPSDSPELVGVRGTIEYMDVVREMEREGGAVMAPGSESLFTFPADPAWFVPRDGSHVLAVGVRIAFRDQDDALLAEWLGGEPSFDP